MAGQTPDGRVKPTLTLLDGETVVFQSFSRWLHPLFELEVFLKSPQGSPVAERLKKNPRRFLLRDTVTGRAGAFLIDRLGIVRVEIGLVSRLAIQRLDERRIHWTAKTVVDRISCMTEELLADQNDPGAAYQLLRDRRDSALARSPAPGSPPP